MIPVQRQPVPADFDAKVRQPGRNWLIGRGLPLAGPLPAGTDPREYWRDCLDDLLVAYGRICAFAAVDIPPVVGAPTVEHFRPKSRYAEDMYEWDNFRLMCGTLNGRKSNHEDVLDPFEIPDGTFQLDRDLGIHAAQGPLHDAAVATIARLKLDQADARALREREWHAYLAGDISARFLRRRSPFVWREMVRLGMLDADKQATLAEPN